LLRRPVRQPGCLSPIGGPKALRPPPHDGFAPLAAAHGCACLATNTPYIGSQPHAILLGGLFAQRDDAPVLLYVTRSPSHVHPTAGCGDIDPCRTPCICERLSTPSDEGYARIMLRGSTTLKTAERRSSQNFPSTHSGE
jgi:hypothetical protein